MDSIWGQVFDIRKQEKKKMRNAVKGIYLVFVALFLCMTLVMPSFAEGIHWYNWSNDIGFNKMRPCSEGYFEEYTLRDFEINSFKEKVNQLVAKGLDALLHERFDCVSGVFSLKDKDLLMAHALFRFRYDRYIAPALFGKNAEALITERAYLLESQYFGIPGGS